MVPMFVPSGQVRKRMLTTTEKILSLSLYICKYLYIYIYVYIYIHLCVCVRVCFKVDTTKNRFRRWPLPISCRIQIQSFKIYQDITGSVQHSAPLLCQKLSPQLSQRGTVGFPLWQVKRGSNDSKLLDKNGYDQESWKKRKCVFSLES